MSWKNGVRNSNKILIGILEPEKTIVSAFYVIGEARVFHFTILVLNLTGAFGEFFLIKKMYL